MSEVPRALSTVQVSGAVAVQVMLFLTGLMFWFLGLSFVFLFTSAISLWLTVQTVRKARRQLRLLEKALEVK